MKQYQIQCGKEINGIFEGRTPQSAFRKAVRKIKPKYLAVFFRFRSCDITGRPIHDVHRRKGKWQYQNPLAVL